MADSIHLFWEFGQLNQSNAKKVDLCIFRFQLFKGNRFGNPVVFCFGKLSGFENLNVWKWGKKTSHHPKSLSPPKKTSCQWYHLSDTGPRAQLPLAAVAAVSAFGTSPWHRLELQSPGFVQRCKSPRFSTSFKGYVSYIPHLLETNKLPKQL